MVQMFQGLPDLRSQAASQIGQSIGQGISGKLQDYYANEALQSVLNNKEIQAKPLSERYQELTSAMSRHGNRGQKILQNFVQVEQQKLAEKEKENDLKKGAILGKRLRNEPLTDEEKKIAFTPQEEQSIAEFHQKMDIANAKATGKKTQASQPIDPDQLKLIKDVRSNPEYESASPAKKYQMLTDNGVSKENSVAEAQIYAEEAKAPKEGSEFAKGREKAITDYVNSSISKGEEAENMEFTFDTAEKAIKSGNISGPGLENYAKQHPFLSLIYGKTPEESTLIAATKKMLETSKGVWGSKPTEREMFLLLNDMLPSIGKTPEANMAGLGYIRKLNDIVIKHSDIVRDLTEGGTKFVPDLENQVNKQMKPYIDSFRDELRNGQNNLPIKVKAPDGSLWNMTKQQIYAAKEKGTIFEPVQ